MAAALLKHCVVRSGELTDVGDANGVPIVTKEGFVQPLGADGQPLPVDAEGNFDATLAIAVDLGRLNVGRSPLTVLSSQYEELLKSINAADSVSLNSSGRLVLTTAGVAAAVIYRWRISHSMSRF